MSAKIDFKYINAELYRHPGERAARDKLEKVPGFKKILDMVTDNFRTKAERQAEVASMIRVGPGVYPVLADKWSDILSLFGLPAVPLHICFNAPQPVTLHGGNDHPVVLLDSRLLESLSEREMETLLCMQAGSIRLGNATLIGAADMLRWFMDFYGIAGAPAVIPAWAMENWRRYSLFSADRAAAMAQGDAEGVIALLQRIAGAGEKAWGGVPRPDDLRIQGLEAVSVQADWSTNKMQRFALALNRSNSVSLIRRVDLLDWFGSGTPARILAGDITDPAAAANAGIGSDDPSLAYWGEFAGPSQEGEKEKGGLVSEIPQAFNDLKDMAEKGVNTFFKAGEAFWNTLTDNNKKQ